TRFRATRQDLPTTRLVSRRSSVTLLVSRTRPLAIRRCSSAPPEAATQPWALSRCLTTPLASPIPPWVLMPALISPQPITLSLSARMSVVRTWTTVALSAKSSVKPLRGELLFLLVQTADLARSRPRGGLKKKLSQWSGPAKRSLRLNQSPSVTRKRLTRQAHRNLALWLKT